MPTIQTADKSLSTDNGNIAYAEINFKKSGVKKSFAVTGASCYTDSGFSSMASPAPTAQIGPSATPGKSVWSIPWYSFGIWGADTSTLPAESATNWATPNTYFYSARTVSSGNSLFLKFSLEGGQDSFSITSNDGILYIKIDLNLAPGAANPITKSLYGKLTINSLGKLEFAWI